MGLRLRLRTWQTLSGPPKHRPFLTFLLHFPTFPTWRTAVQAPTPLGVAGCLYGH